MEEISTSLINGSILSGMVTITIIICVSVIYVIRVEIMIVIGMTLSILDDCYLF